MRHAARLLVLATSLAAAAPTWAQVVTSAERDTLVRLRSARGGNAADVDRLLVLVEDASRQGLPADAVLNKVREGLAKGVPPERIDPVLRLIVSQLESADRLLRELFTAAPGPSRAPSVTLLAEALGAGVTADDVRELARVVPAGGGPLSVDRLAAASKGLSLIASARLPLTEGRPVMGEAARRGFQAAELVELGRDVKRREADYLSGRATLAALREAIARGERPDQIFRPVRDASRARTAPRPEDVAARPAPVDRPERPRAPDAAPLPERVPPPERPQRPDGR